MMNSVAPDDVDFPANPFRTSHDNNMDDSYYATSRVPQSQNPQQNFSYGPTSSVPYSSNPSPANTTTVASNNTMNSAVGDSQGRPSRLESCLSCFRMSTLSAYFDFDTEDIRDRLKGAILLAFQPEKFRNEVIGPCRTDSLKGPDMYGPIWITMTLVFLVAVTSNLSSYIRADDLEEFEYDISHLARAMSVCFTFVFGVPTLWWTVTQCMGMQALMLVDWICLYGYSMVPYLPATIFCLLPWHPWMWLCLVGATVTSGSLILRNIAGPLLSADTVGNKTGPLVLAIMACHIIFLLILKVSFYE